MTPLVGVSLMVFFVFACQCMSTLAIVKRETNSWRWPLGMLLYTSSEAQEKVESVQAQTSDDKDLIGRLNTKIDKEVAKLGSIRKVHKDFSLNQFGVVTERINHTPNLDFV